ncbi:Carboxysome shell carbonic anhydrase [Acidithiobacillus ferrivorans]|uniref:Carboxysome shell carbonic anhydrase n=2 Tax=Acidithiobacillus ferrivorans TaxID=160808 RepID=A0A060UT22_9PROT|nr:carboxysome shell carbonic anhydrase [Acidithiobacillus ferrivorans]OCB01914.1 carboxysome shell carbonic anhydrase [Acidithiobacillus ferrivorans]QQD73349.1 carboxysome shell carbonic anhydrase [Acidithiobacillus ferrivorans]CDQ09933.1 Carboxysome structural polypeptide [Acidithiobacillus ferrivorans]SMH65739.1 Carboxysome shell carbonic anhydrase [Acidithiobacillus ferrivorans]
MNTRNRPGRHLSPQPGANRPPYGLGTPASALQARPPSRAFASHELLHSPMHAANPACAMDQGRPCRHPLSNESENRRLLAHEQAIKGHFAAIIPALKRLAAQQHEADFPERAQRLADADLGFTLPVGILEDAWIAKLDMRALYGACVMHTIRLMAEQTQVAPPLQNSDEMSSFLLDCGYHAVDITPCSDGRLKGLIRYILRLPDDAVRSRKAYAGAMFDVEANVKRWIETELMRYREGRPVPADAGTRYLKIVVYHWSSSDPAHEGCAAHHSNERDAAEAGLGRLREFRQAIENSFCCGASVDTLLIGVDTDTDGIKVHVPDADGEMSLYRWVSNLTLYKETLNEDASTARLKVYQAIQAASATDGWGKGNGEPHEGMRRLIATLLINNLSQIEYVCGNWEGRYPDIGHNERFISVGDGFEEFQVRNLAYFVYLHTVEEGGPDLDVGIQIFSRINVLHGLPVPVAIHFRYDRRVPGSRERTVEHCQRVKAAIESRYAELHRQGLLVCGMTVQDKASGSPIEALEANGAAALRSAR